MKNYTIAQMISVRTLARIQFKEGIYLVSVPMSTSSELPLLSPWFDEVGMTEFLTDREAISYWGEDTFSAFCDSAIAYLEDDSVQERFH